MTKKKKRFKLAREFRKLGIPFKTARKMANNWLRGCQMDDIQGELEVVRDRDDYRPFDTFLFVITPNGGFDLQFDALHDAEERAFRLKTS